MDGRMKILFVVLFHFACMVVLPLFALTVHESPDVYNALRLDGSGIISEPAGHIPICCTNGMSLTGPNVVYWADGVPSGGDDKRARVDGQASRVRGNQHDRDAERA